MFSKSTIKYIQSLQHKKFRDEYGVFVAEGPKVVIELLEAKHFACNAIYALPDFTSIMNVNTVKDLGEKIFEVRDFELDKLAAYSTANKVVGVFQKKPSSPYVLTNRISLVLDDIQDPGNLGTIIRTADWFGIENIICSKNTADCYNPKVVQSTMASIGRVNILYEDLEAFFSRNGSITKYAAILNGDNLSTFGKVKEGLLIIGNESKGVSPQILQLIDKKITIPRNGAAESLNAAVATGIILYNLCIGA